tara:strand:+ start:1030 stop:2298 length:1269 start_codon:yes stop_codon:yes gene_type:complete
MPQHPVPGGYGHTPTHQYYSDHYQYGNYQFINLNDIIVNFTAAYVGAGKILQNVMTADVSYHAHRAFQELHYDTLKSCKSQEIILPPSLTMRLPHDYVNYTKITWSDANGIEHIIYPTSKTSKGNKIQQDSNGDYLFITGNSTDSAAPHLFEERSILDSKWRIRSGSMTPASTGPFRVAFIVKEGSGIVSGNVAPSPTTESGIKVGQEIVSPIFPKGTTIASVTTTTLASGATEFEFTSSQPSLNFPTAFNTTTNRRISIIDNTDSTTWGKYKSSGSNPVAINESLTSTPSRDVDSYFTNAGRRYGLESAHAQINGSFFINCKTGLIHFSSNLNGKTIILHYLSDGHGNDKELILHKFAEEAMYKWIAYGCAAARVDVPENIIQRLRREKIAETRKAKIRLSNIKIEEIAQIMRGKSKFIDH